MTTPIAIQTVETDLEAIADTEGKVAVLMTAEGGMDPLARRVNRLTKGALQRFADSDTFADLGAGKVHALVAPAGLKAEAVLVLKLEKSVDVTTARAAGAALAGAKGNDALLVCAGSHRRAADIGYGLILRSYAFEAHLTGEGKGKQPADATLMVTKPEDVQAALVPMAALAEGVFFTRDLTNEPSNILTTIEFAERLKGLETLGVEVEILEEPELHELGMRTLLAVGQGSASPTKVAVMRWNGGGDEQPFAFVGKGVVFDTGGISLKPASGMEDMVMDMGGAGVVSGVMKALAARKAKANVVGLVGLVENMPSGEATRPGDVIRSMKGDTVEVINTDAEGRLVLADVLWYTQERFNPSGIIDLATLTGAMIVALGNENAGVFSNNDDLADAFLAAARAEDEGAWRMPMGEAYDKLLKSRVADVANVGGRAAGSITAAQFLKRFVKDDMPWIHLDIAGVAFTKSATTFAPKGATGWGVRALDRLIRDKYES
ncbi:leucyl aminopeptidase [Algicella marina]|uniref:Probable cytosol aminopeptidase n=1 Tax=Algicella marina TaxID=2683284 RepID=A0A6P1T0E7_9RHOB|nr:leucyl aminopeptidase [Algicella marina]QHQ34916.1 leucyl aminopeptidase [Algicella marina]